MNNPDFEINLNSSTLENQKNNFEIEQQPVEFTINLNGGARGLKGDKGDTGAQGPQGEQGPQGIQGPAGQDGRDGQDGFSPSASVSKSGATTTITITDKDGTTTAEVEDGIGDMEKSVYDTDNNGIVDNAEKVNNHSVDIDVPSNAVFTDTTYTAGTGISISAENVISNTQTSAEWGNISGDIQDQADLQNALNEKQNIMQYATMPTPSVELSNKIVQYVGTDDTTYRPFSFYICKETTPGSGIYTWAISTVDDLENYQPIIDSSNKLDADLVDDTTSTNKFFSGDYNDLSNKPTIPDELADLSDDSTHRVVTDTEKSTWSGKQDALVSGTNIKTINSTTVLGSGNFALEEEIPQQTSAPVSPSTGDLWIDTDENATPCYDNYSTNETQIGYWIDGKPLYRKVFNITSPQSTNTNYIDVSSLNIETAFLKGYFKNSSGIFNIPFADSDTNYAVMFLGGGNQIRGRFGSYSLTGLTKCVVVLEYTKTTD